MKTNKRVNVIMLPTNEPIRIGQILTHTDDVNTRFLPTATKAGAIWNGKNGYQAHELYFISDDEIREGDHWLNTDNNQINNGSLWELANNAPSCKKIITTTDPKLNLPQPSKAFIEKYVDNNGIDEVLVEYEDDKILKVCLKLELNSNYGYKIEKTEEDLNKLYTACRNAIKPKVNSHNEITIHLVKTTWTKQEVDVIRAAAYEEGFKKGYLDAK